MHFQMPPAPLLAQTPTAVPGIAWLRAASGCTACCALPMGACMATVPLPIKGVVSFFRWHTVSRAVRLGYNVMTMDADSHLSDDPYIYLKSPPLADANLVTMTHGALSYSRPCSAITLILCLLLDGQHMQVLVVLTVCKP